MSRLAAIDYLRTPLGAPWKWEEGGRVLVWNDGTTLLFREELQVLAAYLEPSGLPSFPALVLLLGACRGKFPELGSPMGEPEAGRGQLLLALQTRSHRQAMEEFGRAARLPAELIARATGKAILAEAVFELSTRLSVAESGVVMDGLPEAWGDEELNRLPADAAPIDLSGTIQQVFEGLRRHSAESLTRRIRTGLDQLPVAAPEMALPHEERSRRLLDALEADDNHAGLASVVRDLMAALRLPRTLARVDETAADGVSDIGNRGPLDRLVLSELAYDDLTLATRVALNEALYLRREPPAHRPQRSLAVLLDVGLRMWGVPRVLGAAAALALLSRQSSERGASVWRAERDALAPVDLLTKPGLETHLAALGTDLHPGAALPALQAALAEGEVDVVVVTHRDALADAAFQAELARAEFGRGFLLLVERNGLVQLHAIPWGSPRPLVQVQIEVAKLFPTPRGRQGPGPLIAEERATDLPAIFREHPFPLLLPVKGKMECAVAAEKGGWCVTADRRLLRWEKPGIGALQVATDLPTGRTGLIHFDPNGRGIVVKGRGGDGRMSVVIVEPGSPLPKVAKFTGPHHPLAVWVAPPVIMIVMNTRVVTVTLESGEVRAETDIPPGLRWIHGCYFAAPRELRFVSWDGAAARWDSLAVHQHARPEDVLTVFDRERIGAWIVLRDGQLLSPTGSEVMQTGFPLDSAKVVEGEQRVAVRQAGTQSWHVMDLARRSVRPAPDAATAMAPTAVTPPTRNIQARFSAIWAAPGQPLRLCKAGSKAGKWLEIFPQPGGSLHLVESAAPEAALRGEARLFSPLTTSDGLGCRLQLARWPGGSCAWLDSRGLLHLRSHDPEIPEFTLVLCFQAAMAGWSSTGELCGPVFYRREDTEDDWMAFVEKLTAFCQKIC